jgi:DNA polymerase-3 subunit delta'
MSIANQVPSQVWVGNQTTLKKATIEYLQQQFCHRSCHTCPTCHQIALAQFSNLLWLTPQGSYKLEQTQAVLDRLSYRLGQAEQYYFVFQDAQYLSTACANSLLKSIEEPPAGYHFIFLTSRKELILPTILSRSTVVSFSNTPDSCNHPLYLIFTSPQAPSAWEFSQTLDAQTELTEQLSYEILENIYYFWLKQPNSDLLRNRRKIEILQAMLQIPPMPGSSKLFWREFFLRFFN